MATHGKTETYSVTATQDLSALYRAITLAGAVAANTSRAAGVLWSKGNSGETVTVVTAGEAKVQVGAAINTAGYPLTITTSGYFIAASSGGATVGRALINANSGDIIPAFVDFFAINQWPGT